MQLLLLTLFILFQQPEVQTEQFRHYDTESGLSNNIVYDIFQDHEDFLWIATENGLNRFDGYEFKKYFHDPDDPGSLSSNIARSIVEDKNGNLWIGTFNGLNLFDRKTQSFTRFLELPSNEINRLDLQQMLIDDEGKIWFNTLGSTGWFDTKTREFHFIHQIENSFSISLDKDGNFWVRSYDGILFKYEAESGSIIEFHNETELIESPILWGKYSNKIWLEHESPDSNRQIERSISLPNLPGSIKPLELIELSNNELMMTSDAGLYSFNINSGVVKKIDFREKTSSLTNSIRSVYQDKNRGLWVGTLSGFFHFDPYQKPFSHIDLIENGSDVIMGLSNIDQRLLANTFSSGFISYDISTEVLNEIRLPKNMNPGFYQIWDIAHVEDSRYPIWLATNDGLYLFNWTSDELKRIVLDKNDEASTVTFSIENSGSNFIWVTSLEALYKFSKSDGKLLGIVTHDGMTNLSIQDVVTSGHKTYVATEGSGILEYDIETGGSLIPLENKVPDSEVLLRVPIWDLYLSSDQTIWIGSNQGLLKFDQHRSEVVSVSIDNELTNRVVFSIEEDIDKNLWLATERGLIKFNPSTNDITEFNKSDGVINVEFNRRSATKSPEGKLFFGGVEGITAFNPSEIISNPVVPTVHILDSKVIVADSTFTPEGFHKKEVSLSWNQNTIEFSFAALNYTNPSQNRYKYKLEGYDPDWVEGNVTRLARYSQLPHGEYEFKVLASNNDGLWNMRGDSFSISIAPPYWKTVWFRTLIMVIIVLLLWSLYRYRVAKLIELERVKLRIAGDLHDEVGSGLSGIALTGDILQRQLAKGEVKAELIQRITKNSRVLASSLDSIVWLIDSKKETIGDLISKSLITAKDLLHDTELVVLDSIKEADQKKSLGSVQRRNLFLLVKEALNNTAKHSEADKVILEFLKEEQIFKIKIKDNGKGFDPESSNGGRGLGTMKSRAKELGAKLVLNSSSKTGTEIIVSTKIP